MAKLKTKDGARIHYSVRGKGRPPLIFIHGWCSNLRHWRYQARHFAENHRVLRVDRRGMGRSMSPGTSGQNPTQHAADIAAVARSEGIRDAIVVGHAGGGASTLEFARNYPEIAKAVVMVDSGISKGARLGDPSDPFASNLARMIERLEGPDGKKAFRKQYRGFFSPKADRRRVRKAVAEATRTPISVATAELASLTQNTEDVARELTQPVLWLTAAPADQAYISSVLKNASFGLVVGSGHFPQLETPEQVNAMIDTFIAQL